MGVATKMLTMVVLMLVMVVLMLAMVVLMLAMVVLMMLKIMILGNYDFQLPESRESGSLLLLPYVMHKICTYVCIRLLDIKLQMHLDSMRAR